MVFTSGPQNTLKHNKFIKCCHHFLIEREISDRGHTASDSWAPIKAYFVVSNTWSVKREGRYIKSEYFG